jgi:putative transposase
VVRNGYAEPRKVLTSSGAVEVVAPRVNDKRVDEVTGEHRRFYSAILPPWCRKSPKINVWADGCTSTCGWTSSGCACWC